MVSVRTEPSRVTRKLIIIAAAAIAWAACTPKDDKSKGDPGSSSASVGSLASGPFAVGSPPETLLEAVKTTDLTKPAVRSGLPARLKELAPDGKQPRAASVMLRAVANGDAKAGAALGCELLDRLPTLPAKDPELQLFVDSALVAVANGKGTCVEAVNKRLGKDRCLQSIRCTKDGGRIAIGAVTDQREPLCSTDDMAKEVTRELARTKEELLQDKPAYQTERFAFAALRALGAVPEETEKAHARRQYALKQADKPECGMGVPLGTPCHCDEAALRDQVCRNDTTTIAFSFCRIEVNDAKKELGNVVMSTPP